MSQDTPRYHRFRWRWFWTVFAFMLVAYAGVSIWTHYQVQRWNMRARSLDLAAQSVRNADPPSVIARLGQPTSSTQNGSELVLKYGPPDYPLGLQFRFVNGRPSNQDHGAFARRHVHPVAGLLVRLAEVASCVCLPLCLALAIGVCFHHRYERLFSHLLLAGALVVLVVGVSVEPLEPGIWIFGTIMVALGVLAIRSTYRTPQDDTAPVCDECGYNLTGNTSGICPECGTPMPAEVRSAIQSQTRPDTDVIDR